MLYTREASMMVARQLKSVSQVDAFTISAARNIQYVFKGCVIDSFVKDVLDIYLNKIYHSVFSLHRLVHLKQRI